jgi:serine kinase of HPr protein (carbohydrate metabolism regulator)
MMEAPAQEVLHVSTVAIRGRAVLIEGPSGSGKSDLALRLIDRGAILVSDDYTILSRQGSSLIARSPDTIAGKIEVRGLGILTMPFVTDVPVAMIVRLTDQIERMPMAPTVRSIAGCEIPEIAIDPHHSSAPIKVELALAQELL